MPSGMPGNDARLEVSAARQTDIVTGDDNCQGGIGRNPLSRSQPGDAPPFRLVTILFNRRQRFEPVAFTRRDNNPAALEVSK